MDTQALWLTLRLAGLTTVILFVIGVPLAWWLARTRARLRVLADAAVSLPLVLPPTVLGFYLLVAMGPDSPLGNAFVVVTDRSLVFSFEGLVVASVLYSLPFAVRPFVAAFAGVDQRLLDVSRTLGVSRLRTFWRVGLPMARPGLIGGLVLAFVHTVGEFGVVLMVGGNIAGETRTVSIAIYDDVQALNYGRAGETAAVLVVFAFVALCITYALQPRAWRI